MSPVLKQYALDIQKYAQSKLATEKTYRPALYPLFKPTEFFEEPKKSEDSIPDGLLLSPTKAILAIVETKNLNENLASKSFVKQFERYKEQYSRVIITNYREFEFYENKTLLKKVCLFDEKFVVDEKAYEEFKAIYTSFTSTAIKPTLFNNPVVVAKLLAGKTKDLREELLQLKQANAFNPDYPLVKEMEQINDKLLTVTDEEFVNLYAQTITYGLFSSRYYNPTSTFTLNDLKTLNSNPLLNQLFANLASKGAEDDYPDADIAKIKLHVNALVDILANTDMSALIGTMAKTSADDVIIHFYETFLTEYDPELKKSLGIWYTPEPVVNYMVRGVDELLKTSFKLKKGLSDNSKDKEGKHIVQILDPATGTGNYLNAIIKHIRNGHTEKATWNTYVKESLIPRLHGFEILMTSYSIAHLKLNNTLKETGYTGGEEQFNVCLTNTLSLPLAVKSTKETLFSKFLKALHQESNRADEVKTNSNIKVIIGNPPYNKKSKNQGKHIDDLLTPYTWAGSNGALNDDYIKFTRFAEKMIDDNGSGIIAYISNNSFLSSICMSNMRKSLLKSFDEIYVLDFNGNPKDNIFKIKQTVCITFFVKTSNSQTNASVFYTKVEGSREDRLKYCESTSFQKTDFTKLNLLEPEYYFYPLDGGVKAEYTKESFALDECFHVKGTGVKTNCDALVLDTRLERLDTKIDAYFTKGDRAGASKGVDERKTKHSVTKKDGVFTKLPYRPFDIREYFDSDLIDTRVLKLRKQEQADNQLFLSVVRVLRDNNDFSHVLVSKEVGDTHLFRGKGEPYYYPLYQYTEATEYSEDSQTTNFTNTLIETLKSKTKLKFEDNSELSNPQTFSSLDVMDYIYGWLHDTSYRAKYNDFLKSNYPRVPYPKNEEQFRAYMQKGRAFKELHLSDGAGWEDEISFEGSDANTKVENVNHDGKLLNLTSTLSITITPEEWEFKIGACKVIESWLEGRKGDELTGEELTELKRLVMRVRKHIELVKSFSS